MTSALVALQAEIDQTTRRRDLEPDEIARRVAQLERAIRLVSTCEDRPAAPVVPMTRPSRPHLRDRVVSLLERAGGSASFSELRLALGGSVMAYELQNALRDLAERGAASPAGKGAVIAGRGKAPTLWRLLDASGRPRVTTTRPTGANAAHEARARGRAAS